MGPNAGPRAVRKPRHVARSLAITGALMAVLGPALALGTLLSIASGALPDARPVSDVLAVLHGVGLVAGVLGVLLVVAVALQWLVRRALRRMEEVA